MSKNNTQLRLVQKYQIEAYVKAGVKKLIAKELEVNLYPTCSDLGRNIAKRGYKARLYSADRARSRTEKRHQDKPKLVKFTSQMKE